MILTIKSCNSEIHFPPINKMSKIREEAVESMWRQRSLDVTDNEQNSIRYKTAILSDIRNTH